MGYKTTEKEATDLANQLVSVLGKGWKAIVWENLGWHYKVVKNGVQVHPSDHQGKIDGYSVFLHKAGGTGGIWTGRGKTPKAALKNAIENSQKDVDFYLDILNTSKAVLEDL